MDLDTKTVLSWRRFLASPEGQSGLLFLRSRQPAITGYGKEAHEIIFQAGVVEGHRKTVEDDINLILSLDRDRKIDVENSSSLETPTNR